MNRYRSLSKPLFVIVAAVALAACGETPEPLPPPVDPCLGVACSAGGHCVVRDGAAACECPTGHHAEGLSCVSDDLCAPNPCTDANRNACRVEGNTAVCDCNPGFVLENGACVPERVSCDGEHTEGDAAEPDECLDQVRDIGTAGGQEEPHTIFPAGDSDWYVITAEQGRIYKIAVDADLSVSLEIYGPQEEGQQGPPRLATQTGSGEVALAVKSASELLYVRVRASNDGVTGSYTISISDEGLDDHGDDAASASQLGAFGVETQGAWQFTGDKDVFKFAAEAGHAYKLTCSTTGLANRCAVRLQDAGGSVLLSDEQALVILTYVAPVNGVLYIETALSNSGTAGYTLKVDDLGADDHGNDAASATRIEAADLGTEHTGKWELSGDTDWLRVDAATGHIYRFTCDGGSNPCVARLLDSAGNELDRDSSRPATFAWKAQTASTYFFELTRPSSDPGTGTYTWRLEDLGADDHGDDQASATIVTATGLEEAGKWEFSGDRDWLRFDAGAGHVYRFSCATTGLGNRCVVRVLDDAGNEIAADDSAAVLLTWSVPADAAYFIELRLSNSDTADYTWKLEDLGADDHGNDQASATVITELDLGLDHGGKWDISGDTDWLKFDAAAGHVYRFTCTSGVVQCQARLLDASGVELDKDTASAAALAWKARTAATYYIEISRPASNPGTGAYTWKLEDLGPDDHGDDLTDATDVTATGVETPGRWSFAGDKDVLKFDAGAGHIYRISCATSGPGNQCKLRVLDASGNELAAHTHAAVFVTWVAPAAGPYYLELALSNSGTADYTWKLEDFGPDDHGDDQATATVITDLDLGLDHAGRWDLSGDRDWLKFDATAGHLYRLTCTSGVVQCQARLLDGSGVELDKNTASVATLAWKARSAATYYIEISRPALDAGTGPYTWKLEDLGADDHGDDLADATAITATGVDTDATWEFAGDKDWMRFDADENQVFRFNCSVSGAGNNCVFKLYDETGALLITSTGIGGFVSHMWKAPIGGRYYMEFANSSSSRTGPYTWKLTHVSTDEHGDTMATATVVTASGVETAGMWNISGDLDFLRFDAASGKDYRFTCTGSASAPCEARLLDAAGTELQKQSGASATLSWEVATAATYYIELARPADNQGTGTYSWTLEELSADDHGNDFGSATRIDADNVYRDGTWEVAGDRDVMVYVAARGEILAVACDVGLGNMCVIEVYDANGTLIGTHSNRFASVNFKTTKAGNYFIQLRHNSATATGPYSWKLRLIETDEHGDDMDSATVVSATGVETAGRFNNSGDLDFLRFDAPDSNRYRFTCVNKTGGSGSNCSFTLRDAAGAQIDSKSTGTLNNSSTFIDFTATAGATYYVQIARMSNGTGNYAWKLEDLGP